MARHLLLQADHSSIAVAAPPLVVVLVVAAVVVSLCTSSRHARLWRQRGTTSSSAPWQLQDGGAASRKHLLTSLSGIGSKAATVAKMVSWNRRSPLGGSSSSSDDNDEEAVAAEAAAVWKKAIMMGEKCRPLEFSGHIAFDSDGNQLPPPPPAIEKAAADAAKN